MKTKFLYLLFAVALGTVALVGCGSPGGSGGGENMPDGVEAGAETQEEVEDVRSATQPNEPVVD